MADPFFDSVREIVLRVLAESVVVDYRALYLARVVAWKEGGQSGSGTVDVVFDDALRRLESMNDVPYLPGGPGVTFQVKQDSLVLIGWRDGDERYPFAVGWAGSGGAAYAAVVADAVDLGSTTASQLDKVVTRAELQAVIGRLYDALNNHIHAAGTLGAPMGGGAVTGATAPGGAVSGSVTLSGSPTVRATKP